MKRLEVAATAIAGLMVVTRMRLGDDRGSLTRLFCAEELQAAGWRQPVSQINHTMTVAAGTIRGMHYQSPPWSDAKLVSCLHGSVWDVAIDLRADSPTFLQWHAEELSESNQRSLLIPSGFAHGYQTLSADCELIYLHSEAHHPEAEAGLNAADPKLSIPWPLEAFRRSDRDLRLPMLDDNFTGLRP